METKKHFKMYKSGKKWLVAAIVAGGMATAGSVVSANADEVATANAPAQTSQTEQVQESTAAVTSATVKADSSAANSVSAASNKVNSSAAPTSATASSSVASTPVVNKAKDSQTEKNAVADDKKDINESTAHNSEDSQKDVKEQTNNTASVTEDKTATKSTSTATIDKTNTSTGKDAVNNADVQYKPSEEVKVIDDGMLGNAYWQMDSEDSVYLYRGDLDFDLSLGYGPTWKRWNHELVKKIFINPGVKLGRNMEDNDEAVFNDNPNLTEIIGGSNLDTSETISFSGMLRDNPKLKSIDVSNWNMSNAGFISDMFAMDSSLEELDVSNWDTSNIEMMGGAFLNDSSLTKLDVSKWNVGKTMEIGQMFYGTSKLKTIDVSHWKLSPDLGGGLFSYDSFISNSGIQSIDLSNWNMNVQSNKDGLILNGYYEGSGSIDLSNKDLWEVKLSSNSNVPLGLTDPDKGKEFTINGKTYITTGKWQAVGEGTVENPKGAIYDADTINSMYLNGKGLTDVFVWAHAVRNSDEDNSTSTDTGNKPNQNNGKNNADSDNPSQDNGKNSVDSNQPAQNDGKNNAGGNASNANDVNNGKHANGDDTAANNAQATDANNQQNGGVIVDPNGGINNGSATDHAGAQSNAVFAPQDRANGQTRSKQSNQATAKTLPQTNEKKQSTTLLSVIGLAMLSLLAAVGLVKKPRKN
ncbi:BspA family leucine-rich repeat surface protein [Pediococcus acidilactici]|uniref:BspA family leucine-rich repeat surface protein n=1 Tax=Pediococcus acidilactici TaxID=1254 RepID=UPI00232CE23D|nr:BspA family leucine-rich repeat surface protein [Pediococcus acidilactici]MDB8859490.1 BspA family leucine-rich repeat surface protein [Pediococcus acidilactici]MDB8861572.1 BspA family leucine-rich repeat surface protein [Pediococcus acidilactici]MDB8863581.1 BspA family leucine-rich repeat surface protein [Pediococcus acidilactici]MDB8866550.1 BspA family leucine-rich repeat surface protein [Pediococcus acidilactici]